jgi:transposase
MARQDLQALRRRRRQAVGLFARGATQAEVARRLGVSRQTALVWSRTWARGGAAALREPGRAGRPCRLGAGERKAVERALLRGPRAHGFATDLWTLPRIAVVIERVTGVAYHPGHVWKLLRQLGWSLQRPTTRARERDEIAVGRWVRETWSGIKKTPPGGGRRSSSSTRAGSPNGRRSGGPGRREVRRRS